MLNITGRIIGILLELPNRRINARAIIDFLSEAGYETATVSRAIRNGLDKGTFVLGPNLEIALKP